MRVPLDQLYVSLVDRSYELLGIHSDRIPKTQLGRSILEKEAFAAMASIERPHWWASCSDGFELFTDYNNVILIIDILSVVGDIGQAAVEKVLRWTVHPSSHNYVYVYIRGDHSVWADLLTRWRIPLNIRRLVAIPPFSTITEDSKWPLVMSICESQNKLISYHLEPATASSDLSRLRD